MNDQDMVKGIQPLEFDQDHKAHAVVVAPQANVDEVLAALGLTAGYKVILLTGSAAPFDESDKKRNAALFSQGILGAADENTVIIDGATQEGVAELIGQSTSKLDSNQILLGVAPLGKVFLPNTQEDREGKHPLDPNHTHFVLVQADHWQGATKMMFDLAEALASSPSPVPPSPDCELEPPKPKPRLTMLLVGGSPENVAVEEALVCVQRGWSLMVVEGSGRLADLISQSWKKKERIDRQKKRWWLRPIATFRQRQLDQADPRLQEILQKGKIQIFSKRDEPLKLKQTMHERLTEEDHIQENILRQAWKRYALYSNNAKRNQRLFRNFRNTALFLAWFTTLVVLLKPELTKWAVGIVSNPSNNSVVLWLASVLTPLVSQSGSESAAGDNSILESWLHFIVVLLPIITAALLTAETRLKSGNKWIALRAAAEATLGGIYSYRLMACCPDATKDKIKRPDSAVGLAQYLRKVTTSLVQTEITDTALEPSPESIPPSRFQRMGDDGFSAMSGEMYVRYRLLEQRDYFQSTTNRLERTLQRYRWWIWIFGGLGTLLAAFSQEYWLPLTVGTVTALTAYLEYQQVEQNLMAGNQSEAALSNVMAWWISLPVDKRESPENLAQLLDDTETILESNVAVWVKQMQDAQEKAAASKDN